MITIPSADGITVRPIGLDFTAVMAVATASNVDLQMLTAVLPHVEAAIINPPAGLEEEED